MNRVSDRRVLGRALALGIFSTCFVFASGALAQSAAPATAPPAAAMPAAPPAAPPGAVAPPPAAPPPPMASPAAPAVVDASAAGAATAGPAPEAPAAADTRKVGGHIGIATPLVSVDKNKTTTPSDQFTLLVPIGIGFTLGKGWLFDFETVVATPAHPKGTTGLVVDPGVVYDAGAVALGIRVAFQTNSNSNFGLIPLIHKGVVDLGGGNAFVEAAFPTFVNDNGIAFNAVLHIGVGF